MPQSGSAGSHGQPQAGSSPSTPGPSAGGSTGGATGSGGSGGGGGGSGGATGFSTGAAGAASFGLGVTGGTIGGGTTGGGAGGGAAASGTGWANKGPARRGRGWRDWRRGDPTLIKGLWKSKGPLGNEFTPFFPACGLHCVQLHIRACDRYCVMEPQAADACLLCEFMKLGRLGSHYK